MFMNKLGLALCFLVFYTIGLRAQFRINEAGNRNFSQVYDEFGETEDWIEIYNSSSVAQNLAGFYLSDNPGIPTKWMFP